MISCQNHDAWSKIICSPEVPAVFTLCPTCSPSATCAFLTLCKSPSLSNASSYAVSSLLNFPTSSFHLLFSPLSPLLRVLLQQLAPPAPELLKLRLRVVRARVPGLGEVAADVREERAGPLGEVRVAARVDDAGAREHEEVAEGLAAREALDERAQGVQGFGDVLLGRGVVDEGVEGWLFGGVLSGVEGTRDPLFGGGE
ncbi:hypothetical protein PLICRDRAFT_35160 [Plicaturopsis crispa FD-325 SS-3]|nr:hypothetical protein PLICRDRAFT_35160 [Plicaturopsis crispa FD-325 SS-3]